MECAAAPPAAPILMLPGPAFPAINFDVRGGAEGGGGEPGGRFTIQGTPIFLDKDVGIDALSHTEKTAGSVWDCSLVLAKYLEKERDSLLLGRSVLELGAGQGVVGLACALAGASGVILTDVAAALPMLNANISINKLEGKVRAVELDWMKARQHATLLEPADTIVAADTVWVEGLAVPFVRALALTAAKRAGVRVLLCHRTRSHRTDDVLFGELKGVGFEWEEVSTAQHDGTFRTHDVKIFSLTLANLREDL